jgi:orotidine-5'-phosphate decarboxylase
VLVLCRTSNPDNPNLQFLPADGKPLYPIEAGLAAQKWNVNGEPGLVVSEMFSNEIVSVRAIHYASKTEEYTQVALTVAKDTRDRINAFR